MENSTFDRQREEDLQRLRGFRLLDDDFMAKVFEDKACAELLLRIILKKNDLDVKEVYGQLALKNLQGRSGQAGTVQRGADRCEHHRTGR